MAPRRAAAYKPYSAPSSRSGPPRNNNPFVHLVQFLYQTLWMIAFIRLLGELAVIIADFVTRPFRRTETSRRIETPRRTGLPVRTETSRRTGNKVVVGLTIFVVVGVFIEVIGYLSSTDSRLESCVHAHQAAYARFDASTQFFVHRSLEQDTDIFFCASAAKGDYGPCLRNSLNSSKYDGRVTYDSADTMKFFLRSRPRLLEQPPRSSIFNILSSSKPSFDVSRLSPTQRKGLVLWSKCTYPRFGQTLTRPLNLSCPFQAFNLLFFHNTLGNGQMFHPTKGINPHPPPKHIDDDLQHALAVSIPQEYPVDRIHTRRILHIGATPLYQMSPLEIEHTPHNLAKILSQLLHEMLHVTQYIYTCPVCYSDQCAGVDHPLGGVRYRQMWLPLTVAIDLMLAKEGVLEIPGVNWKEHRLNLHADHVAAVMKNPGTSLQMQADVNGEKWDYWEYIGISDAFQAHVLNQMADGTLHSDFPSWRPDSAPYLVA